MDDLIKRQDAVNELSYCQTYLFDSRDHDKKISLEDAEYTIERLPSAQKKGRWNFIGDNLFKCTCCGKMYTTQQLNGLRVYDKDPYCPFFCPNCGADMRGEDDG